MPVVYLKRHRMQIDLRQVNLDLPDSPSVHSDPKKEHRDQNTFGEIVYLPWGDKLITLHSLAKWESFRFEIDASVFPCLGDREGCKQLMRDLSQRANFVPEATWLAMGQQSGGLETPAGTIQGLRLDGKLGAIQNIGVVPAFRGRGIGQSLLRLALQGFRDSGCNEVQLEVTVHNLGAIRLYESVGFRYANTVFKVGNIPVTG